MLNASPPPLSDISHRAAQWAIYCSLSFIRQSLYVFTDNCRPLGSMPISVSLPGDVLPPNHEWFDWPTPYYTVAGRCLAGRLFAARLIPFLFTSILFLSLPPYMRHILPGDDLPPSSLPHFMRHIAGPWFAALFPHFCWLILSSPLPPYGTGYLPGDDLPPYTYSHLNLSLG